MQLAQATKMIKTNLPTLFVDQLDAATTAHDVVWRFVPCGMVREVIFAQNSTKVRPSAVVLFHTWITHNNPVHDALVCYSSPLKEYRLQGLEGSATWNVSMYHPLKATVHPIPSVFGELAPFQITQYVPIPGARVPFTNFRVAWAADVAPVEKEEEEASESSSSQSSQSSQSSFSLLLTDLEQARAQGQLEEDVAKCIDTQKRIQAMYT
jgi:hypothetical protein